MNPEKNSQSYEAIPTEQQRPSTSTDTIKTDDLIEKENGEKGVITETKSELKEFKESTDFLISIDKLYAYLKKGNLNGEISNNAINLLKNCLQSLSSSEIGGDRDWEMLHFMNIFAELNKEIISRPDAQAKKPNWTIFRDNVKDMFGDFTFNNKQIQKEKETESIKLKIGQGGLKSKEEYLKTL